MPYTTPTAAQFKARFAPVFDDVENDTVDAVLAEMVGQIDETWVERDYQPAAMYLTAHQLVMEGALGGSGGGAAPFASSGFVTSESLGDASVGYSAVGAGSGRTGSAADYAKTSYGLAYMRLLRQNQAGPMII